MGGALCALDSVSHLQFHSQSHRGSEEGLRRVWVLSRQTAPVFSVPEWGAHRVGATSLAGPGSPYVLE